MRNALAAGLATLALACAPLRRDEPELPIEPPAAWAANADPSAVNDDPWWQSFGDPALDRAVLTALNHNYDLAASAARVERAVALARLAGADLLPAAGVGAVASRDSIVFPGFPGAGGGPLQSRANTYGASLDVSWEADLWGRLRARKYAATDDMEAARSDYHAAQQSLAAQTAKSWFAWRESLLQADLARRAVVSNENSVQVVERRFRSGRGSAFDLRLAETELAAARAARELTAELVARVGRQLEVLMGQYPDGVLGFDGAEARPLPELPPPPGAGLPSELLQRRPDLVAADRRLRAADHRLYEARAAFYPRLSLTASGGRTTAELGDLVDSAFNVWSIAGNLVQPLYEGGRLEAGEQIARAELREVLEFYAGSLLRAFGEVEISLAVEAQLLRQEAEQRLSSEYAAEAYLLARGRYAAGLENIVAFLLAQRQSIQAESRLYDTQRRRIENRVDLFLALGGGFGTEQDLASHEDDEPQPARRTNEDDGKERS